MARHSGVPLYTASNTYNDWYSELRLVQREVEWVYSPNASVLSVFGDHGTTNILT